MAVIPLGARPPQPPPKGLVPFALGFRPFFLLAGLAALGLMALWLPQWMGWLRPSSYYGLIGWHSHEMLFGYAVAVVAGFLLTAVRNWTGLPTPTGRPLAGLALLWLAGRLLPLAGPAVPGPLIAWVDGAFLPLLAAALAGPLWRGQNRVNRLFLPLLAGMALANLLVHLQALGIAATAARGQQLMLDLLVLLVALVGGRVIPFFTEKAIAGSRPRLSSQLEWASFALLLALVALDLLYPWPAAMLGIAALASLTQALRLALWHHPGVWRIPILWVLYSGYAWLVLGLALRALGAVGLFPPHLALHALTVGGFGVLTLGMMARVALGHTGRELHPHRVMGATFWLLNLAALVRVFGPPLLPGHYTTMVQLAGGLWLVAFLGFVVVYTPILLHPRLDGRQG
jgi:uncharacterized protein involved in response to NO